MVNPAGTATHHVNGSSNLPLEPFQVERQHGEGQNWMRNGDKRRVGKLLERVDPAAMECTGFYPQFLQTSPSTCTSYRASAGPRIPIVAWEAYGGERMLNLFSFRSLPLGPSFWIQHLLFWCSCTIGEGEKSQVSAIFFFCLL